MAATDNITKVKIKDNYYPIKDAVARESKLDKLNPSSSGYIASNVGGKTPGVNSVSLGYRNDATGAKAVALGSQNEAAADFSVATGLRNKTVAPYQTAIGKYNLPNIDNVFEVGYGESDSNRANVFKVTKYGDVFVLRDLYIRGMQPNGGSLSVKEEFERLESEIRDSEYELPKATTSTLGGVVVGDNINIDRNGVISVTFPDIPDPYVLPKATDESLGGIKVGQNLEIENDGTLNVILPPEPDPYILPKATADTLGGIKVSTLKGFKIENDGTLAFAVEKLNQNNPNPSGYIRMNSGGTPGAYSVSLGYSNLAKSDKSVALGMSNDVSGIAAAAIGNGNIVNGQDSITLGKSNTVTSRDSYTVGSDNENGAKSFLIGKGLESDYDNQFVLGLYNSNSTNNFLEIGKGTSDNDRKNILSITNADYLNYNDVLTVTNDGNLYIDKKIFVNKTNNQYIDLTTLTTGLDQRVTTLENLPAYNLPKASAQTLGGIKVGNNLSIDADGVLSADLDFAPSNLATTGYFSHNRTNLVDIGENSFASNGAAMAMNSTTFGYNSIAGKRIETTIEVEDPETGEITEETEVSYSGTISFAEGYQTKAEGYCSHTAGYETKATDSYQFVIGYYNDNKQNNLFEIGNGTQATRSNVFEVDRNGNTRVSNTLSVNGIQISTGTEEISSEDYDELTCAEKNLDIFYLITDTNELYYKTNKYGSGEVELSLNDLTNIEITNLSNEQILQYNSTSSKWENVDKDPIPEIEANPQNNPTDTLQTIEINNTVYDLNSVKLLTDEDLDDIFTDGYQVYHADDPSSITNLPTEVDGMFDLVSSGTEDNDEYTQYLYFKDTIYTRNAANDTWSEWAGISGGGGSGNVADVYVNGTSVLDENHIAQVPSYKELTQAEYDALPDSKYTDGILYCIKDEGIVDGDKFAPVIYSLEEREIGVWTDGRPLYQKTVRTTISLPPYEWVATDVVIPNGILISIPSAKVVNGSSILGLIGYIGSSNSTLAVMNLRNITYSNEEVLITLQYTKSTDVPGSGEWTSTGVPAVHYSTDEQIIGTWIDGKPLYQKTINFPSNITLSSSDWSYVSYSDAVNIDLIINGFILRHAHRGKLDANVGVQSANGRLIIRTTYEVAVTTNDYITLQYTKATD